MTGVQTCALPISSIFGGAIGSPSRSTACARRSAAAAGIRPRRAEKRPAAVLLTHAHLDHAYAAGIFAGDDVPVFLHEADAVAFDDVEAWNPGFDNPLEPVKDLRGMVGGDELSFAGFSIEVRHTPGHTPGHCCFVTDATLIAGDLVFAGSIGRSDFPNSSPDDMWTSLRWFLTLDDTIEVLPGHGPRTTVGRERASNPFLAELS